MESPQGEGKINVPQGKVKIPKKNSGLLKPALKITVLKIYTRKNPADKGCTP